MKVCIVSSCGGHLTEVRHFRSAYGSYSHFYVINSAVILPEDMERRTYVIRHCERNIKLFVINLWEAYRILRRERPTVILSTGAGPVVAFALIARMLFPTKIIYVETLARVSTPSLTGRLMYPLAHSFYYQWPQLRAFFPQGTYGGPLI